jgi:hypothetical protein
MAIAGHNSGLAASCRVHEKANPSLMKLAPQVLEPTSALILAESYWPSRGNNATKTNLPYN